MAVGWCGVQEELGAGSALRGLMILLGGGVGPATCVRPCNPTIAWLRVTAQSGATSEGSLTTTHSVASPGLAGSSRSCQQDVSPQAR